MIKVRRGCSVRRHTSQLDTSRQRIHSRARLNRQADNTAARRVTNYSNDSSQLTLQGLRDSSRIKSYNF